MTLFSPLIIIFGIITLTLLVRFVRKVREFRSIPTKERHEARSEVQQLLNTQLEQSRQSMNTVAMNTVDDENKEGPNNQRGNP
jgi:hypothetical protein